MTPPERTAALFERLLAIETDECVIWPRGKNRDGYGIAYMHGRNVAVHVQACERTYGPRPEDHEASHRCGIASCMNPRHLRWATRSQNSADKIIHGTSNRGSRHGLAKLTADDVREIRRLDGIQSLRPMARALGISQSYVYDVARRLSWEWLDEDQERTHERTVLRGEGNPRAALTAVQVREIRDLIKSGMRHRDIAARFGVTRMTVTAINNRRVWAWLD